MLVGPHLVDEGEAEGLEQPVGGLAVRAGLPGVIDDQGDFGGALLGQQGQGLTEQLAAQAAVAARVLGLDPVHGRGAIGSDADQGFGDRLCGLTDDQSVAWGKSQGKTSATSLVGGGSAGRAQWR